MNSSKAYWQIRIKQEIEKLTKASEREITNALKKIYKEQGDKLYNEIIKAFVKYQGKDGTLNDLIRTNKYFELLDEFNKRAKKIGGEQVIITEKAILDNYQASKSIVEKYVPKGMIRYGVPQSINAENVLRNAWCKDGKVFSDRIWKDKNLLVETMRQTMTDQIMRGKSTYQVASAIEQRVGVSFNNAYRIARTEIAHAQIQGQADKYKEMGFTMCQFVANDPCDECGNLDGQQFTLDQITSVIPQHPNCRCGFSLITMKGGK